MLTPMGLWLLVWRGCQLFARLSVQRLASVWIATGERMFRIEEFRELLETRSVNIVQPDCSHCGGISALFNIARLAEAYEVALAPHCPLGPIALAACLQVD